MPATTETAAIADIEELERSLDGDSKLLIRWSRSLASRYGAGVVRLNHLFLAFLEQREALETCANELLQSVLRALGTRPEWIDALPAIGVRLQNSAPLLAEGPDEADGEELPLSEDFRMVLERSGSLSERLGDAGIEPKHLLLGLFSDELRQFREKFLSAGSAALMSEAREMAQGIVEAARTDATRIVQGARREADKILDRAETNALRAEVLSKTKEEIVRLVMRHPQGWTLSGLGERLGVSWQSLIWPCRQLVQEDRLRKQGKLYLPPDED
jgi:ATP-dependent Clp protease ATP-binding subunit ClpA